MVNAAFDAALAAGATLKQLGGRWTSQRQWRGDLQRAAPELQAFSATKTKAAPRSADKRMAEELAALARTNKHLRF